MKFINKHKTKFIIGICAILIIGVIAVFGIYDGTPALENVSMTAISPVQKFLRNIGNNVYDVTHSLGLLKELRNRVGELESANGDMEKKLGESEDLASENDRLKRMLELRQDNPDLAMTAASVAADEPSVWFSGFTVDKGKNSGISKDNIVVSEDGFLIGKVVDVGNNWASVMTALDPGFSAGVMVERSRDLVIAEGDAELREKQQFRISNMSRAADIQVGDYITTTGLGGIFPAGFRLGKVAEITEDSVTMTKAATVDLCFDIKNLRDVFIITNSMDIVLDEENANMSEARKKAEEEQEELDRAEAERIQEENESSEGDSDESVPDRDVSSENYSEEDSSDEDYSSEEADSSSEAQVDDSENADENSDEGLYD